jgi:hypothetical protein
MGDTQEGKRADVRAPHVIEYLSMRGQGHMSQIAACYARLLVMEEVIENLAAGLGA